MTIAEVCRLFDISADTLHYYERIGLIPKVNRTKGGVRDYTKEDLYRIEFARCMRSAGLPVEVLIDYVALSQQGDSTREARRRFLTEQLNRLLECRKELKRRIERLNDKIGSHERTIALAEKALAILEKKEPR